MARPPSKPSTRRRRESSAGRWGVAVTLLLLIGGGIGWWLWETRAPAPVLLPPPATPQAETPPPPRIEPTNAPVPAVVLTHPIPVALPTNPAAATASPPGAQVPALTNAPAAPRPIPVDLTSILQRPPTNILEAQIALTAYGIGSGSIDGIGGAQTAWAFRAFQFARGLEETGRLDRDTQKELKFTRPLYRSVTVSAADLAELRPVPSGWVAKSGLSRLGYETLLEQIAEQSHASPGLLRRLNPSVNWTAVPPGTSLVVPNASYPPARRAALVRISLANRYLRAFDGRGGLLAHFPCSIGRIAEKRPVGELQAVVVVKDPNYTFNPAVFSESAEARQIGRKLIIPPGPNNPVGIAWMGLSRAGYGIHGTPIPEQVGRTESHGCFRLANWNADYLRQMMAVGTPVWVEF